MQASSKTHDAEHVNNRHRRPKSEGASAFFEGIHARQHPFSAQEAENESFFQPKLQIHPNHDTYEAEADRIADQVTAPAETTPVQRRTDTAAPVQNKPLANEISPLPADKNTASSAQRTPAFFSAGELEQNTAGEASVQPKGLTDANAGKDIPDQPQQNTQTEAPAGGLEQKLQSAKGKGIPLSDPTRRQMESSFGTGFDEVRTHTGPDAVQMNRDIGARAFTHGHDIYFNEGQYQPGTREGDHLLAHELTHVVQQNGAGHLQQKKDAAAAGQPEEEDKSEQQEIERTEIKGPSEAENQPAAPVENAPETKAQNPSTKSDAEPATDEIAGSEEEAAAEKPEKTGGKQLSAAVPGEGDEKNKNLLVAPNSPEKDPAFQQVRQGVKIKAAQQKTHDPASSKATDAQSAAQAPENEVESTAKGQQVERMAAQKPGVFDKKTFKEALKKRIAQLTPKNLKAMLGFKESDKVEAVEQGISRDVKKEKKQTGAAIEQKTAQAPPTAGIEPKTVTPLPPEPPHPGRGAVNPGKAAPKPKTEAEISLQEGSEELDQDMVRQDVTREQLANSNEPQFIHALRAKEKAQEDARTAPVRYREAETRTLAEAKADAGQTGAMKLGAMLSVRKDQMQQVGRQQQETIGKDEKKRKEVAQKIDGFYQETKKQVEQILSNLDKQVITLFRQKSSQARENFLNYADSRMRAYKKRRYSGPVGKGRWLKDKLFSLPSEVNEFYETGRKKYLADMDLVIDEVANLVASGLNAAMKAIQTGKKKVQDYVDGLDKDLKKFGKEALDNIQDKFDSLEQSVKDKQEQLTDALAEQYVENLQKIEADIRKMKEANKGYVTKAKEGLKDAYETIKKLKKLISALLSAIRSVIPVIIRDPIGFARKLFSGIGQGIRAFKANIKKHLTSGFIQWLTGALGPMGIVLPPKPFSLPGIFNLVAQILGITWPYIRKKAVRLMGEPAVQVLEKTYAVFQTIRKMGIDGIWEFVKGKFTDLKETVMGSIKEMLITKIIVAGVKWLMSLLIPGAGFIKAVMAIKDLIVFFVESAMVLIPALTKAILAAAAGSISLIANAIEKGLALLIAPVLSLLARLLGISGLTKKVKEIVKKIHKRIDREINKLILKAKSLVRKLFGKGKKAAKTAKEDPKKAAKIQKGLADIDREEKKYLTNGKIAKEEAIKVAVMVKRKHKVFKSIKVIDGGDKWNYEYAASPVQIYTTKTEKEETNDVMRETKYIKNGKLKEKYRKAKLIRVRLYGANKGYPEDVHNKAREIIENLTDPQNPNNWISTMYQESLPKTEYTIEHSDPTVKSHWNNTGYNDKHQSRLAFFTFRARLGEVRVLSKKENEDIGRKDRGKPPYKFDIGPNFTGPDEKL